MATITHVKSLSAIKDLLGTAEQPTKEEVKTMSTRGPVKRLEQKEYYQLYKWLEDYLPNCSPGITLGAVSEDATRVLGFEVTRWHIQGALKTIGKELPSTVKRFSDEEKVKILARSLSLLWNKLYPGETHGDDLKELW